MKNFSQAPTGRKTKAQGKESRDAALGPPPPQNPSPVGATQLPTGWVNIVIEDCLLAYDNGRKIRQGWSPQCEGHPAQTDDDWGVLKTSAIQDGFYVETANKRLPENLEPRTHLEVEAGDILITCAGPRSRCGVACLVRKTRPKLLISGKMYQLRADPEIIDKGLLEMYLREPSTQKLIDEMKTGISDSGLNLTHSRFATLNIPRPPAKKNPPRKFGITIIAPTFITPSSAIPYDWRICKSSSNATTARTATSAKKLGMLRKVPMVAGASSPMKSWQAATKRV